MDGGYDGTIYSGSRVYRVTEVYRLDEVYNAYQAFPSSSPLTWVASVLEVYIGEYLAVGSMMG